MNTDDETRKLIDAIKAFYDEFSVDSLDGLSDLYTDDVTFTDPIHQVQSLDDLRIYYKHTMENVDYCHFSFTDEACAGDTLFLAWQMRFSHPKLANGREIVLPGTSQFNLRDHKVAEQRDYYDLGAMLYEHVPLVGYVIGKIKQRLVSE